MTRDRKKSRRQSQEPSTRELEKLARARDRQFTMVLWIATAVLTAIIAVSMVLQMRAKSYAHIPVMLVVIDLGCLVLAIIMTVTTPRRKK